MRRGRARIGWTLSLAATLWLVFVPAANAYIDAGTTAIVFQAVVAGLAAAGMFLRVFWRRITRFFSRDSNDGELDAPVDGEVDEPAAAVPGEGDAEGVAGR